MFTCKVIKNGATYLGKHLRANDYYDKRNEVTGRWLGEGAKELGLSGKAIGDDDKAFEALRLNIDPRTGEQLTPRTSANRRAFYDFQISAPKDVSILAVTFGDERLREAHDAAMRAGFAELEKLAGYRLEGGRGGTKITGNLVAAAFTHDASRELDAQLHTHLVCANATFDTATGKWYALENSEMFAAINLAGRVYQAELARQVRALGYEIEEDRVNGRVQGFNIAGMTEEDRRRQSTRRLQIEAEIAKFTAEKGRPPTAGERHVMATETRGRKLSEITTAEVRQKQRDKYSAADLRRLEGLVSSAKKRGALPARKANHRSIIEWAADHVFERKAVASEKDLIVAAIEENLGSADVAELRAALRASPRIARIGPAPDGRAAEQAPVASAENLLREREAIALVESFAKRFAPLGKSDRLPAYLKDDQRLALERLLSSTDGVTALRGPAGAGKTTTLRAFDSALRAAGYRPIYATPQHAGRRVLASEGFENPRTVAQLLLDVANDKTSLQGAVLVVDESGLLSGKSGHELLKTALASSARVVLVGDEKQMSAIEAGDFLAMLKDHSPIRMPELQEIRRQVDPNYREAMRVMSGGRVREGFLKLDSSGLIHNDGKDYLAAAAKAFLAKGQDGETVLLVAPTWAEIDKMTETVRAGLRARGTLKGRDETFSVVRPVDMTAAQRRHAQNFRAGQFVSPSANFAGIKKGGWYELASVGSDNSITLKSGRKIDLRKFGGRLQLADAKEVSVAVGDRLLLRGNEKRLGVSNGMFVTVRKVSQETMVVEIEGEKKPRLVELPNTYRTFVHGYAVTAHRSQGVTVDHAIVAAARLDGKAMYVASSRGRQTLEVHVPDKARMIRETPMGIEGREAAVDYAGRRSVVQDRRETYVRRIRMAAREFYQERLRPTVERVRERMRRGAAPRTQGRL